MPPSPNTLAILKYCSLEPPSPLGLRVAELMDTWRGFHHFNQAELKKTAWDNPYFIVFKLDTPSLSTFDGSLLTSLVFLAHDFCIRVEVNPRSHKSLELLFHQRKSREGGTTDRHPTIETALAKWRQNHPQPEIPTEAIPQHA